MFCLNLFPEDRLFVCYPPLGGITGALTVISHSAVNPPSLVVTVILAFPGAIAFTLPDAVTVAIALSEETHLTVLSSELAGSTVAFRATVSPTSKVAFDLSRVTFEG